MLRILWHKLTSLKPIRSFVKNVVRPTSNKYSTLEKPQGSLRVQAKRPTYRSLSSHVKRADTSIANSNQEKENDWSKVRRMYSGIHMHYMDLQEDLEQEKEA